jgi:anti-sigma factor RsiW
MKCEDFEMLMADALGDELAEANRGEFEEHLGECARCRAEYEAGRATVRRMQAVDGPAVMAKPTVPVGSGGLRLAAASGGGPRASRSFIQLAPLLRYAAVIAVAFIAGYGVRDASIGASPGREALRVLDSQAAAGGASGDQRSFESALTSVYRRRPAGSDLGKVMSALFRNG